MQEFAKIVGIPHTYLSQMIGGRKNISPEMAEKIEKASNGDIPRMMLLYPHEYFPEDEIKEDGDEKNEE
jgi:DNA-binding transcriptional regulator YdaS (Cro superfamily)